MTNRLFSVFWFGVGLFCCSASIMAGDARRNVAVATYTDKDLPEMKAAGGRAGAILRAANIDYGDGGSTAGMTISVPTERSAEALRLLAKAIKAEGLHLSLVLLKGDQNIVVTPDSILSKRRGQL